MEAFILLLAAIGLDIYLIYLCVNPIKKHLLKEEKTQLAFAAEREKYFKLMDLYGFDDHEIVNAYADISSFEDLKRINKEMQKHSKLISA